MVSDPYFNRFAVRSWVMRCMFVSFPDFQDTINFMDVNAPTNFLR